MSDRTTDDIQHVPSTTPHLQSDLAKKLHDLVPEAVTDGKVDFVVLKELLGDDAADGNDRFGLFWPGKKRAMRAAQEPTTATLKPAKDESVNWDDTENVFIEGDNLEVLKVLQRYYHNKIKMIYIDPPYNTGKDFVYPDNYKEGLASYLEFTKQVDEAGRKVSTNSDTDGRYHSNWLNMMYPRLKLARNLLTDDGVICISIGDDEVANLRRICDEIFGEANFVTTFHWLTRSTGGQVKNNAIIDQVEYVLMYSKNSDTVQINMLPNENAGKEKWRDFRKAGGQWQRRFRPNQFYPFYYDPKSGDLTLESQDGYVEVIPADANGVEGFWENGVPTATTRLANKEFRCREVNGRYKIEQLDIANDTVSVGNFIKINSTQGGEALKSLFDGKQVFDNPKSIDMLKRLIHIGSNKDSIIMDFFSGSASSAHATMELNVEDGGTRRYIQVQLPESVDEKTEAYDAGFRNIADIAKERLRRAGNKLSETAEAEKRGELLDIGFRVYKLSDTNFAKWQTSSDIDTTDLQAQLLTIKDSSNDAASEEDLLTEVLLKRGASLTARAKHIEVDGLSVWSVEGGAIAAYLYERVKPIIEQLRAVAALKPTKLIVLEDAFAGDDELKTNLVQICKTNDIELWTV